uniref:Uncharacterized protein n=1 Tax=Anguilla anguilla TaxID=7936 RepID=A0A0E9X6I3_ANGAN
MGSLGHSQPELVYFTQMPLSHVTVQQQSPFQYPIIHKSPMCTSQCVSPKLKSGIRNTRCNLLLAFHFARRKKRPYWKISY